MSKIYLENEESSNCYNCYNKFKKNGDICKCCTSNDCPNEIEEGKFCNSCLTILCVCGNPKGLFTKCFRCEKLHNELMNYGFTHIGIPGGAEYELLKAEFEEAKTKFGEHK